MKRTVLRAVIAIAILIAIVFIWIARTGQNGPAQDAATAPPRQTGPADTASKPLGRSILSAQTPRILRIECPDWPGNQWLYRVPEFAIQATDTTGLRPAPAETRDDGSIVFSGNVLAPQSRDLVASYRIVATPTDGGVSFQATVTNRSFTPWNRGVYSTLCLENVRAPDFIDLEGGRTSIMVGGEFLTADSTRFLSGKRRADREKERILSELSAQAEMQALKRSKVLPTHRAHLLRSDDWALLRKSARKYFNGSEFVSSSLIVRTSGDGRRHVAVGWGNARHVSYNLAAHLNCIHSEPRFGGLLPNESRTESGKIYFVEGPITAVYERFRADFPALGFGR